MKRVVVIGTSSSGKTTLAREIARAIKAPHVELDALYWRPDWKGASEEEFRAAVANAAAGERWVIDGNYGRVRDLIWPRATTVVWLNYPLPTVFLRGLARTIRRIVNREELFASNRETFRRSFLSADSILWWILTSYKRRRREYRVLLSGAREPGLDVVELATPGEARSFLDALRARRA